MKSWQKFYTPVSVRAVYSPSDRPILLQLCTTHTLLTPTDLHTARGTASGPDGKPITKIKLPHVGGHEGVGRIVSLGTEVQSIENDIRSLLTRSADATITPLECPLVWAQEANAYDCVSVSYPLIEAT